jgi:hypothetical protein
MNNQYDFYHERFMLHSSRNCGKLPAKAQRRKEEQRSLRLSLRLCAFAGKFLVRTIVLGRTSLRVSRRNCKRMETRRQ